MTNSPTPRGGKPLVKGAFFCESVLEGKDGTNSYIRVIDRIQVQAKLLRLGTPPPDIEVPELPDSLPDDTSQSMWLVIMLVGGGARGRVPLQLSMEGPDGLITKMGGQFDLPFDGREHQGLNVHLHVTLKFKSEGVHWIHAEADGVMLTQIPFSVEYQRTL